MEYAKTLAHLKKQWGQFINLVLAVEEDDATRVMDKLCRPGFPDRFLPQLDCLIPHRQRDDLP